MSKRQHVQQRNTDENTWHLDAAVDSTSPFDSAAPHTFAPGSDNSSSSNASSSNNKSERNRLSREEIIVHTAQIIAHQGLHKLTMRRLADALDCSVGTLPHYFSGKAAIVDATFNWSSERILKRIETLDASRVSLETFAAIIHSTLPFDAQADLEWRVRLALWNYANSNKAMREAVSAMNQIGIELLHNWADTLQQQGKLRKDLNLPELAHTTYHFINGLAFSMLHMPLAERQAHLPFIDKYINNLKEESSF